MDLSLVGGWVRGVRAVQWVRRVRPVQSVRKVQRALQREASIQANDRAVARFNPMDVFGHRVKDAIRLRLSDILRCRVSPCSGRRENSILACRNDVLCTVADHRDLSLVVCSVGECRSNQRGLRRKAVVQRRREDGIEKSGDAELLQDSSRVGFWLDGHKLQTMLAPVQCVQRLCHSGEKRTFADPGRLISFPVDGNRSLDVVVVAIGQ